MVVPVTSISIARHRQPSNPPRKVAGIDLDGDGKIDLDGDGKIDLDGDGQATEAQTNDGDQSDQAHDESDDEDERMDH